MTGIHEAGVFSQSYNGVLGHCVCRTGTCSTYSSNGAYIDDVAATKLKKTVDCFACAVKGRHYINFGEVLHHFVGHFANGAEIVHHSGIVYEDIELAIVATGKVDDVFGCFF